jgi:hypothetical protein
VLSLGMAWLDVGWFIVLRITGFAHWRKAVISLSGARP